MLFHATIGQAIAVTAGIVLTKGGSNSALPVGGGRESKPWLIKSAHPPLPFDTLVADTLVTGMGQAAPSATVSQQSVLIASTSSMQLRVTNVMHATNNKTNASTQM